MFARGHSNLDVRRIADAVASAADLDDAYDRLIAELSQALETRGCLLLRGERGWALASQSRGGMRVSIADLLLAATQVPPEPTIATLDLEAIGQGTWTSMTLDVLDQPAVVLLAGDWTQFGVANTLDVLLSFVLRSVREHELRQRAERLLIEADAAARQRTDNEPLPRRREADQPGLASETPRTADDSAPPPVSAAAGERLFREEPAAKDSAPPGGDLYGTMTRLTHRARQLCGTAGVAVYLAAPSETEFRASVTWVSDAPVPHTPSWMPDLFNSVLETGRSVVLPDLAVTPSSIVPPSTAQEGVGGLVAVPVTSGDLVVGMVCVFDLEPLAITPAKLEALAALGALGSFSPSGRTAAVAPSREDTRPTEEPGIARGGEGEEPDDERSETRIGVLDRRGGTLAIRRELARAGREQGQLSVVLFDVDPSPSRPDFAGRRGRSISFACEALVNGVRGSDLAVRWSHNELLLVLPGLSVVEALRVAERLCAAMQTGIADAAVAGGVAELLPHEPFEALVARATERVRLARERGHNRVA